MLVRLPPELIEDIKDVTFEEATVRKLWDSVAELRQKLGLPLQPLTMFWEMKNEPEQAPPQVSNHSEFIGAGQVLKQHQHLKNGLENMALEEIPEELKKWRGQLEAHQTQLQAEKERLVPILNAWRQLNSRAIEQNVTLEALRDREEHIFLEYEKTAKTAHRLQLRCLDMDNIVRYNIKLSNLEAIPLLDEPPRPFQIESEKEKQISNALGNQSMNSMPLAVSSDGGDHMAEENSNLAVANNNNNTTGSSVLLPNEPPIRPSVLHSCLTEPRHTKNQIVWQAIGGEVINIAASEPTVPCWEEDVHNDGIQYNTYTNEEDLQKLVKSRIHQCDERDQQLQAIEQDLDEKTQMLDKWMKEVQLKTDEIVDKEIMVLQKLSRC